MSNGDAKLFQSISVGNMNLSHRVVMAPLTRFRATDGHVPTDMMADMYAQRANPPGTFLISEGMLITAQAGGYENTPGIWTEEQVECWKKASSSFFFQFFRSDSRPMYRLHNQSMLMDHTSTVSSGIRGVRRTQKFSDG